MLSLLVLSLNSVLDATTPMGQDGNAAKCHSMLCLSHSLCSTSRSAVSTHLDRFRWRVLGRIDAEGLDYADSAGAAHTNDLTHPKRDLLPAGNSAFWQHSTGYSVYLRRRVEGDFGHIS